MRRTLATVFFICIPFLSLCQTINNTDTCRTKLYYQQVGAQNKNTYISKARSVQGHGIINAGFSRQAGRQNALIFKQSISGEVIWQKEYGTADYDEEITDWRELASGQLLVAGTARNKFTQHSIMFLTLLSGGGNIVWQKTFADLAPAANISNVKIFPDYYGDYFFAAEIEGAIIYGMLNASGNVNWQQSILTKPGTKLIAATSHYSQLLVATNSFEANYQVANFYYVDHYWTGRPRNIKYTNRLGGAGENADYILHDFEQVGQYTYFSGIRSVNNGPYEAVRVNINQGLIRESLEVIKAPGITLNKSSRTTINTYGDVVSFATSPGSNEVHAIKLTASNNYPTEIVWSTTFRLPDAITLDGAVKTWDGGYLLFGQKSLAGDNKTIAQVKMDSASVTAACVTQVKNKFEALRMVFREENAEYSYLTSHGLTSFNYILSETAVNVDTMVLCKEVKCPTVPIADSCLNSFQKLYQSYTDGHYTTGLQIVNDRIFTAVRQYPMEYVLSRNHVMIAEINKNGQVIHQRSFFIGQSASPRLFKDKKGNLLLYGNAGDPAGGSYNFLAKIDTDLNIIWLKSWRSTTYSTYSTNMYLGEVKQADDGSYFVVHSDGETFGEKRMYLTKLTSNGEFVWTRAYTPTYPSYANFTTSRKLEVHNGHVYIMCINAFNSYSASILLKVSENNGNLVWCKKISTVQDDINLAGMVNIYNNELYLAGDFSPKAGSLSQNVFAKLNLDGKLLGSYSLKDAVTNFSPDMNAFQQDVDGKIYMGGAYYAIPPIYGKHQSYSVVNSNFEIITAKKRSTPYSITDKYFAIAPTLNF